MTFLLADICVLRVEECERVRNLSTGFKKLRKNMEVFFFFSHLFWFVFGDDEVVLFLDFVVVVG